MIKMAFFTMLSMVALIGCGQDPDQIRIEENRVEYEQFMTEIKEYNEWMERREAEVQEEMQKRNRERVRQMKQQLTELTNTIESTEALKDVIFSQDSEDNSDVTTLDVEAEVNSQLPQTTIEDSDTEVPEGNPDSHLS